MCADKLNLTGNSPFSELPISSGEKQNSPGPLGDVEALIGQGKLDEAMQQALLLRKESLAAEALIKRIEGTQLTQHAEVSVGLMQAFFPAGANGAPEMPAVLGRLREQIPASKSLKTAFSSLSNADQAELKAKVGEDRLSEILSISDYRDSDGFWQAAAHFGTRLKQNDQLQPAMGVLGMLSQGGVVPEAYRKQAETELNAIIGKGEGKYRAEFLVGQFAKQACDLKTIVPMIGGSAIFSLGNTAILGRLAMLKDVSGWWARGMGARALAGTIAFMGEVGTFYSMNKGMAALYGESTEGPGVGKELLGTAMTLGTLKLFGFLGNQAFIRAHGVSELGVATQLQGFSKVSQAIFPQVSQFMGMMASHKLEENLGLRPHVDGATTVMDTVSSLVSLGAGGYLGHKMLGSRYASFEKEMGMRANIYTQALEAPRSEGFGKSPIEWLTSLMKAPKGGLVPAHAMASVMNGGNGSSSIRPEMPLGSNVMMNEALKDGSLPPGAPGSSEGNGGGSSPVARTWLKLGHENGRVDIRVPEVYLPQAERLWESRTVEAGGNQLETLGAFLQTVVDAPISPTLCADARKGILQDTYLTFRDKFLSKNNIHAVTRGLANQAEMVRAFNQAKAELGDKHATPSALLEAAKAGDAGLFTQFGGQANSYFGELRNIYQTYPEVRPLIEAAAKSLAEESQSAEAQKLGFHTEGMDVLAWLKNADATPSDKYLSSSAVSQPLIGLTQLAHYFVTLKQSGKTPGEMRALMKGTTGHSQGVMSSVVVASSESESDFIANTQKSIRYLIWQGIRMQQVSPESTLHPDIVAESVAKGDGVPTQMLGLLKLTPETVTKYVERANKKLPKERQVDISLVNGPRAVVVSGHPESLHLFREELRADEAKGEQGRIPYSDRKLELVANYFPVSAEFHSRYMEKIPAMLAEDMRRLGIDFNSGDLAIPVYNTYTGEDMRQSPSLLNDLILNQSVQPVNWEKATAEVHADKGVTHVLDFGPGGSAGIGAITARNKEGTGVQVILAGAMQGTSSLFDKSYIFDGSPEAVRKGAHWAKAYEPKLVRLSDGTIMVDTKFTRLIGKPPVMAAGMTPTSAHEAFNVGVINAGFHGELAGGGQHTEKYFRDRVDAIMREIPAGEGITTNLLFLNAYLWGFQHPLVEMMSREGKPMDGVTIAAGVPTPEKASEVLKSLRENGIRHVAFKPGNIASIKEVIDIAKANPESEVILQWTGGRGGGHHSYEDFHQPILETYAAIRRLKNITLVAGSGFGDAADAMPYMTGEWSKKYGYPEMPYDAILLGSRLMVAKEAATAPEAKKLLTEMPGIVNEAEWENSYQKVTGGTVTVISELGEPIHKAATEGMLLWKEFDENYFTKKADEKDEDLAAKILKDKDKIIAQINERYQKLYFGQKSDGTVTDLPQMTYSEVVHRMIELMYVAPSGEGKTGETAPTSGRWMDVTFRDRVYDFMVRLEDRFHPRGKDTVALLQSPKDIEKDPYGAFQKLIEKYPQAAKRLIGSEDIDYFMNLCKRPGKPVNFIPVIDKDLKLWFKKDSLWQSEDLAAVPGQDVQRVAILQGPVAVRYSTKADEPVGEILGSINAGFIDGLKAKYGDESNIPMVEYIGGPSILKVTPKELGEVRVTEAPARLVSLDQTATDVMDVMRAVTDPDSIPENAAIPNGRVLQAELPSAEDKLPPAKTWLEFLAGPKPSWLRAMLTTPHVMQGKDRVNNPIQRLLRPRPGQRVEVSRLDSGEQFSLNIFDADGPNAPHIVGKVPSVNIRREGDNIFVTVNHVRPASDEGPATVIPLTFEYKYNPKQGYAPIHEVMEGRNQRVKDFYGKLWFGDKRIRDLSADDVFQSSGTVFRHQINNFRRAIGNNQEKYLDRGQARLEGPQDMAINLMWEPLIKTIFPKIIDADIFKLVDLSKKFDVLNPIPLQEGDSYNSEMRIVEIRNLPGGKRVTGRGKVKINGENWMEVESQLFIRGNFKDFQNTFSKTTQKRELTFSKPEEVDVLLKKNWFKPKDGVKINPSDRLILEVHTEETFKDEKNRSRVQVLGRVTRQNHELGEETVGVIDSLNLNLAANVVQNYLDRMTKPFNPPALFENGGYRMLGEPDVVKAPKTNDAYAVASRDFNPIHVNPYVADLAELPTTITHGMWTSANGRRVVETYVTKNRPERILSYKPEFTGMVKPGDTLSTQVTHVGMKQGRQIVEVETVNQEGTTVLKARVEIAPDKTAYVFTGQGSAEPGMGMDLYDSSPLAKSIWDKADKHLRDTFGFSILEIVRKNPKSLTLSFGGPKGAKIRQNLMALRMEVAAEESGEKVRKQVPIFPEITEKTNTFTFKHPEGLLYATQFTQPAITLLEVAGYADMRSKGLVPNESSFAGHSLGEYASLAAVGDVFPPATLAELVFLRGMTMQGAVARDAEGRSPYRMMAVSPRLVGSKFFKEDSLKQVVDSIAKHSGKLLEIVNYNVQDSQYVAAGDVANLEALQQVLLAMRKAPGNLKILDEVVPAALKAAEAKRAASPDGILVLEKTGTKDPSTPLPGIDVPFHSSLLRDGVPAFRSMLEAKIPAAFPLERLEGRYIPNLTAKPFSLDRSYVEEIVQQTNSPVLQEALGDWENISKDRQVLGRKILIELLAYQFASPVRWIETQDLVFNDGTERMIEVGPAGFLKGMARNTLKGGKFPKGSRDILSFKEDADQVYFRGADAGPAAAAPEAPKAKAPEAKPAAKPAPAKKEAPAPQPAPVAAPVAVAPAPRPAGAAIADAQPTALEALKVMLAVKLKKSVSEIGDGTSVKDLVGGKSALQNEILGDLQKEFGAGPDNSAELKLDQLAQTIGGAYSGSGKASSAAVDKLISSKMPGGFGRVQVRDYLASERRLGEGRVQGVMLHALTMEPPARLGSETEAKAWLDQVVDSYGQKVGQSISKGGAAAAPVGGAMPVMMAAGPAAQPVPDAPISPIEAMRALLAVKLKKAFGDVSPSTSIKDLVGGKSALQNEILGELQKEFGNGPDNSAELPLSTLAQVLGGSYNQLGKVSSAAIAKALAAKMPGGFGVAQAREYLKSERLLGEGRVDGVLALALTMEPAARLGSETEAKAWLDSVADAYAGHQGISVPRASQGGGGAMMMSGGGAIDSAALKAFETKQEAMIRDFMKSYAEFLGEDPRAGDLKAEMEATLRRDAEKELALWHAEHGEFYGKGIAPIFDSRRMREYESEWNSARTDALELFNDLMTGKAGFNDAAVEQKADLIVRRASPELLKVLEFNSQKASREGKETVSVYLRTLAKLVKENIGKAPTFTSQMPFMIPVTEISDEGEIVYKELPRPGIKTAVDYAKEMRDGSDYKVEAIPEGDAQASLQAAVDSMRNTILQLKMQKANPDIIAGFERDLGNLEGRLTGKKRMPYLFLKSPLENDQNTHVYDPKVTNTYLDTLQKMAEDGVSFQGKNFLLVGAGRGSIAIEVVKNILAGGGTVVTTTLFGTKEEADFYRDIYEKYGAKGSRLVTVPMNQGSLQDTNALVKYIYDAKDGLGLDLDGVIPFAALPEPGRDIGNIDSRSEFSHRLMLTNVIRLLGAVKNEKKERGIDTRPAHVILPMSPNHGAFGFDGLYAESKIGLEPLFNKWKSEGWSDYLSIAGAVMGWTRGTGVMAVNNPVSQGMEKMGARTFSQGEMAFNLTALLHPDMVQEAQKHPVWADLNGGFSGIKNLNEASGKLRAELAAEAARKKAQAIDERLDQEALGFKPEVKRQVQAKADFNLRFPDLPSAEKLEALKHLQGTVDLDKVVVSVGIGEVGPYGSSRTRWEAEAKGEFSLEGSIELAWTMGLIKYHNGQGKDGKPYTGWVDAKTNDPVPDHKVKELYEKQILEHTGIRIVEPSLFEGYDPKNKKFYLREVVLTRDMNPIEVSNKEEAEAFKLEHGDKADIYEKKGQWYAQLKKGATMWIPKALRFDRFAAGQIPTGWDPMRYGVPKDIIDQVDPTTLYTLISTAEALVSSGILDPYELYQYMHVSEVGNTIGGGMGGMRSYRRAFRERFMEKPVQGDILQEQLINVMPAWINMLLFSSSGPIKTPVGACATAAESVEIGVDTIMSGKAKFVVVGGYDDFGEEGSQEFANMGATSNTNAEMAAGRDPKEMSRPTSKTRSGFMESQGAAVQFLTTGTIAKKMGLPVLNVVALTHTASDKQGRSVPAPGQGVLTAAREDHAGLPKEYQGKSPLLDMEYRRKQLLAELDRVQSWIKVEVDRVEKGAEALRTEKGEAAAQGYLKAWSETIDAQGKRMVESAFSVWGNDFFKGNPRIAPLRGALAVFGLDIDDIGVTSFHGTSTQANDKNESGVVQQEMEHLGRSEGNPLYVIAQKWLTGHPKGAAAGWMFNGLTQTILSGMVPGNRALDNVDPALRANKHLVYPNRSMQTTGIKAGLMQSFGFGQAGAQILLIHPDYFFATMKPDELESYAAKRAVREASTFRHWQNSLTAKGKFMEVKDAPPYLPEQESDVLLDPSARAVKDEKTQRWVFPKKGVALTGAAAKKSDGSTPPPASSSGGDQRKKESAAPTSESRYGSTVPESPAARLGVAMRTLQEGLKKPGDKGTGVDAQEVLEVAIENADFLESNFTAAEIAYCQQAPDPRSSFAGRWAAKEAVVKAITSTAKDQANLWRGAGAPMQDIEIVASESGAPRVVLKGHALEVARALGITDIDVSISHSGGIAIAAATAR